MKFNFYLRFVVIFAFFSAIYNTQIKTNNKEKKAESISDLLKNYNSEYLENNLLSTNSTKSITIDPNANLTIKMIDENPDILLKDDKDLGIYKAGWLRISDPDLKETARYPRLNVPGLFKNNERQIPTERNFFRVNENYFKFPAGKANKNKAPGPYYFWFYLTKKQLYYSVSNDSIEVLGAKTKKRMIDATYIKEFAKLNTCFIVNDFDKNDWTLCAETPEKRNDWICLIRHILDKEEISACKARLLDLTDSVEIIQKVTQPIILIPIASPMCNENFNYNEKGKDWECDCKEGN